MGTEAMPSGARIVRGYADDGAWDAFVRTQPTWTHFHLSGWSRVFRDVLGHEDCRLAACDSQGRVRGVLPLMRIRSPLFGHFLVSMPFVNHGGPLGSDEVVQALVAEAVRMAADDEVDLLELRSRTPQPIDLAVSHRKVAVLLPLPDSPDALFKAFPAKLRSQVRRPQKEGVTVRFGRDCVADFHRVFSSHMRDLGTPTHGVRLFEALADAFGDDAWTGVAYHNGTPIACGMGFRWDREFEITWASSLRAYNRVAPNMLLYWEFMQRAMAAGCARFNFGRSTPGASTHKFKLQWGGHDEMLHWYQVAKGGRTATPNPDSGMISYAPRVWRRLPLPLANRLGPLVVRLIP